jgi:hypothetical protein
MPAPQRIPSAVAAVVALLTSSLLLIPPAFADDTSTPSPAAETPTAAPTDPGTPTPEPVPTSAPTAPVTPLAPVVIASNLPLRTGAHGWRVRHVQERLGWLGYEIFPGNLDTEVMGKSTAAAVKAFQSKFGYRPTGVVGPGTWELLDLLAGRVGRLPAPCLGQTAICIDKTTRLVRLVVKDKVVLTLDARFGFEGAATREGTFDIYSKSRDHISSLYRTSMPFALFFSGGQAVHYSPYFARDGYNGASHGCVNLRDYDRAAWLFAHVAVGTRVHVYRS